MRFTLVLSTCFLLFLLQHTVRANEESERNFGKDESENYGSEEELDEYEDFDDDSEWETEDSEEYNPEIDSFDEYNPEEDNPEEDNAEENNPKEDNLEEDKTKEDNIEEDNTDEDNTEEDNTEEANTEEDNTEEDNTAEDNPEEDNLEKDSPEEDNPEEDTAEEGNPEEDNPEEDNPEEDNPEEDNERVLKLHKDISEVVDKAEKDLQALFDKSIEKAKSIGENIKKVLGNIVAKIMEIRSKATEVHMAECVKIKNKEMVELVGKFYRSPPEKIKNVKAGVEETKEKIRKIRDRVFNEEVENAKSVLRDCLENNEPSKCQSSFLTELQEVEGKAMEEIAEQFGNARDEVDNTLEIVEKWEKKHDIDLMEQSMQILTAAEDCVESSKVKVEL